MELSIAFAVLAVVVALALIVSRAIGPSSMWRRRIPGVVLVGLGLALLGSQLPPTPERLLFGLAMFVAWGGTGLALTAGWTWARIPGLVVSGIGLAVAVWVTVRGDDWANEPARSADRILVDAFFLADGPHYSWLEVGLASMAFAILSAVAGGFLLATFRPQPPALDTGARVDP